MHWEPVNGSEIDLYIPRDHPLGSRKRPIIQLVVFHANQITLQYQSIFPRCMDGFSVHLGINVMMACSTLVQCAVLVSIYHVSYKEILVSLFMDVMMQGPLPVFWECMWQVQHTGNPHVSVFFMSVWNILDEKDLQVKTISIPFASWKVILDICVIKLWRERYHESSFWRCTKRIMQPELSNTANYTRWMAFMKQKPIKIAVDSINDKYSSSFIE